jgi:hypothetical protein
MTSAAELILGTERRWSLDVWQLEGPPDTWAAQLEKFYARAPVFAVVSGLGGGDWDVVDAFCASRRLPCWFPSTPVSDPSATYTLHFHGGVAAEARALAQVWRTAAAAAPRRVIQLTAGDSLGAMASHALHEALREGSGQVRDEVIDLKDPRLPEMLKGLRSDEALVSWVRPEALTPFAVPEGAVVFSGTVMGSDLGVLPTAWRGRASVLYPYELPATREPNMAYFHAFMAQRRIPAVDEAMQSEVYFAFSFFTDTVAEMLDNLYRDYLIERAEMMIDRREASHAEAEYFNSTTSHVRLGGADVAAKGPVAMRSIRAAGKDFLHRGGTTIYPRLSLAPGQRIASKGAYLVTVGADGSVRTASEWVVP